MLNMERIPENNVPSQFHPGLAASQVFLGEEESSTCLLLSSPSPTPLDFGHPLGENPIDVQYLGMPEIACINEESPLPEDPLGCDSSSSADSNSVVHDPVSAQLINNISMLDYQHLSKTDHIDHIRSYISQDEDCKMNGTAPSLSRKLPEFVNWNWNIIRKVLLWVVLSGLFACCAAVVALVVTLPKACDPELPWFQGNVFYEIFPASFEDSNGDGVGDLNGLTGRVNYIKDLGIKAVRLNSIFHATHYPDQYFNIISLYDIDPVLGKMKDFHLLLESLHDNNISLILDLPVYPHIKALNPVTRNESNSVSNYVIPGEKDEPISKFSSNWETKNDISNILKYWVLQGVDGFYIKGLEYLTDDPNFVDSIQEWHKIVGDSRPLIVSHDAVAKMSPDTLKKVIYQIDLVDVHIDASNGTERLKKDIQDTLGGLYWSKPGYPWVHWNFGSLHTKRLSSKVSRNISLALTMLEVMLPGTPSIFYGDEINLEGLKDVEQDFHESKHVDNLTPMTWSKKRFAKNGILPWIWTEQKDHPFHFIETISKLCRLRSASPTIYLNGVWKEGSNYPNTQMRNSGNVLIVERWYPRRNSFVLVSNIGQEPVVKDLSSMFYGGTVMVSSDLSLVDKTVYFGGINLDPGVVTIIKLEK